ncbi:hypothetical protein [Nocardia callitridis]|uniref:Transposase n=1 Tax=Nocardia callitridis TaxID=648753 RepID=A0ABP9KWL4_9NOCA
MTLEEVAADLYARAPGEFVAARGSAVAAARKAGDKQLATAVGKLRKPTVAAWTANLLAREAPDEVDSLLQLGEALRTAQRQLSGEQLRALTAQRQQVVAALGAKACGLAEEHGKPVGEAVARAVAQTLTAALADPAIAEQVRTGTLATAQTYEGFGPNADPTMRVVPAAEPEDTEDAANGDDSDARRELEQAESELESASTAHDVAEDALADARNSLSDIDSRISTLREELTHAEQERKFAHSTELDARTRARSAQQTLERAQRAVEHARTRVGDE